ncbi:binding-protein-dependent transport systems inner membrane component [Beutenbergia cavernae DSM 12333]|uniref:Binding-protein-dependent transport systems inner membrane component n=2 Tax=Beutenbergia TaxID=84756 RepID=C5BZN0_BEUC1|nr:binding-protein-dependent transport systems inner membrane component [Beutenbergia cavernae DSM 12333]
MTLAPAAPQGATVSPPRPRQTLGRRLRRVPLVVWVFLAVPLVVELAWVFWPAINSFWLSTTSWRGVGVPESVGLGNYRALLEDPIFATALRNNAIWVVLFGGASVVGGLALAVALNRPRPGVGIYRSAIYLPMVFSLAVTGLFWRVMYQPGGSVNTALELVGLGSLTRPWLADPETALYAVLIAAVWRQVGYIMVLYLAGLKSCDPTLEEAASVDGASAWQRFWHVVMPQLRGVNTVVFAVTVIDSLRTFDIVWAMTRGGPYNSSQLLSTYMFQQGFTIVNLGYGSAVAVVIFVLAIAFIITYLARASRQEED